MITEKTEIAKWFRHLQDQICQTLEQTDGRGIFKEDRWKRSAGGGGRTRVLQNGQVIEKGGVLFSAVHGLTPHFMKQNGDEGKTEFYATGLSIVLHPHSPMVPIIHMNIRYFEMSNGTHWFGGGIDLTPHYVDEEDARFFHGHLRKMCNKYHSSYYPRFKQGADDYFYIKHRQETRGIGGIFFDQLSSNKHTSHTQRFAFVQSVGRSFLPIYTHLMQKNASIPYGDREREWQMMRRGRYVEFNLVYDRGTKFGLDTDGRTESILVSMPPQAHWQYDFQPDPGSREEQTLKWLRKGVQWTE